MRIRLSVSGLITSGSLLLASAVSAQDRPNVILIYTDDQGTLDVGCYGTPDIVTPNLDRLAEKGTRFTQFYGAPVSSASRAGLLTGQFNKRAGETGNSGAVGLPLEKETIAERMKTAGYNTALIGKWHLGSNPEVGPNCQGFDYFWGFRGGCIDNYSHFFYWSGPNRHDLWRNGEEIYRRGAFFAEENVKEITGFIDRSKDEPFFIYWAANMPHYPYQPSEKWLNHYETAFPGMKANRVMYAAFISTFDEYLGQVMLYLKEKGMADNTVVIFQSDNGYSTEERAFGGGGYAGPYRGAKFSLFDGGIRVPAIISWPGVLPEGQVRSRMAINADWFPTIVDLCGVSAAGMEVDGVSLVPYIKNAGSAPPHDVLHFDYNDQWAVRHGDWKLQHNPVDVKENGYRKATGEKYFLSNLSLDPSETINYFDEKPAVVKELMDLRDGYVNSIAPVKRD